MMKPPNCIREFRSHWIAEETVRNYLMILSYRHILDVLALQSAFYQESTDTLHVVVKTPDHFEVCTYPMTTVNDKIEATWNICQDTDYHAADVG